MKNNEFDSFVIIEKEEKNNIKEEDIKEDIKLKKNESDEENDDSVIISYQNNEKDIIYKDYCILTKKKNKNKKLKQKFNNIYNLNLSRNDYNDIIKRNKTDVKNNTTKKRSDSSDFEKRISSRYVDKKQKEYYDKNINDSFEIIDDSESKSTKPFKTECILHDKKNNSFIGELTIDNEYKVKFELEKNNNKTLYYNSKYYTFSLLSIKSYYSNNNNYFGFLTNYFIEINLKDNRSFLFKFPPSTYKKIIEILENYVNPEKNTTFFNYAYLYHEKYSKNQDKDKDKNNKFIDGWDLYNFEKEFKRQNIDFNQKFYVIDNSDFSFCNSYPKKIIVPNINTINIKQDLKICAEFRTKKRLPILAYRYSNGVCIYRCSQTRNGFMGKNEKDVILLTKIADKRKLMIYDCRPKLNAWVNKLKGAGYENTFSYPNIDIEILFCGIPNIHAVRSSYEKMFTNISFNTDNEYSVISNLPDTCWYETIIMILKSSFKIYNSIAKDKNTVLVHCSDGWDRTSQLTSTSEILLDKYYRTLEGFIVLIEKEWLSFGHQFRYRNNFYSLMDTPTEIKSENQFSPIFIQWLDCIYQLMYQNLTKFEFNTNLLTFLADEVYEGKYGTFLFNNEYEREKYKAKNKTVSIWTKVMENKNNFMNPLYDENNNDEFFINYKKIKLWKEYFYKYEKGENEELYTDILIKKINEYKNIINEKTKIRRNFYTFY